MEKLKIGINGYGRIGRMFHRIALEKGLNVVAVNDLADTKILSDLLNYDSVHREFKGNVTCVEDNLIVNDEKVFVMHHKHPMNILWGEYGVDIVLESTGKFTNYEGGGASDHLRNGAGYVLLSAPGKDEFGRIQTIVIGANEGELDINAYRVISNASCTTNCLAPIVKVLDDMFGIEYAFMDTTHAYTNDQNILDQPHSDSRRSRAGAQNIIPTSTGATSAIGLVLPNLEGKIDGYALRVPIPDASLISLTVLLKEKVSVKDINSAFMAEAHVGNSVIEYSRKPLVSSDIIGNRYSAVFDSELTNVNCPLVNVKAWYDNECGYAARLVDLMEMMWGKINIPLDLPIERF